MSSLVNIPFEPREQRLTSLLLYVAHQTVCVAFLVDRICPTVRVPISVSFDVLGLSRIVHSLPS
jgi:hypothetical protein